MSIAEVSGRGEGSAPSDGVAYEHHEVFELGDERAQGLQHLCSPSCAEICMQALDFSALDRGRTADRARKGPSLCTLRWFCIVGHGAQNALNDDGRASAIGC